MPNRPLENVTSTTPVAVHIMSKVVQVARTDTTPFPAFVLPKGAVYAGAYVIGTVNSNAGTSANIVMGTDPAGAGLEFISGHNAKTRGNGYYTVDGNVGAALGQPAATDLLVKAAYAETGTASTTGGPWLVKVEYYFPQQGYSY